MTAMRDTSTMTATDLLSRLRRHYIEPSRRLPGGIFVPEVGMNGGYGAGRRCDAVYVGFTTTSGRQLIGHEIKVSRSDWVAEMGRKNGKADAWADECQLCQSIRCSPGMATPLCWWCWVPSGWSSPSRCCGLFGASGG